MSFAGLRRKTVMSILVGLLAFSLNSCVYLVIGGLGAVGGYMISPDTAEGVVNDRSQNEVWNKAIEVVSVMGVIEEKNDAAGMFIAKIQGSKVTVTISRVSDTTVKITIKARKALVPKSKLAQDVYVKILESLNK